MDSSTITLIVSSDKDVRERFSRMMEKVGNHYVLESVRTKALVRILETDVKLVIMDTGSQAESDIDFLHAIKKLRPRMSVITITDDPSEEERDRLYDEGVKYIIIKPFNIKNVTDIVSMASQ